MGPSPVGDGDREALIFSMSCPSSFNGAVACWRRRGSPRELDGRDREASMGPSPVGDGELVGRKGQSMGKQGFNGAVACWRRRADPPGPSRPAGSCFNGAVACWRRRVRMS